MLAANLIGNLIFSGIGFVAFMFGKKQARIKTTIFGILLMVYPYFISDTFILYAIGIYPNGLRVHVHRLNGST